MGRREKGGGEGGIQSVKEEVITMAEVEGREKREGKESQRS